MTDKKAIVLKNLEVFEINAILVALQELPAKIANPLTKKIREQVSDFLPKTPE